MIEFNLFSATLGYSRFHYFEYTEFKQEVDFKRCLVHFYKQIGGLTKELLTDNMAAIVNVKDNKKTVHPSVVQFFKDIGVELRLCKVRSPQTKGKDEVSNKYAQWLKAYDGKLENKEHLIRLIEKLNIDVNKQVNTRTNLPPVLLFAKEKEYLSPLPNKELLDFYEDEMRSCKVPSTFLIEYKGGKYSVPPYLITKTVNYKEREGKLFVYYEHDLVAEHELVKSKCIDYQNDHYKKGMEGKLKDNDEIEKITTKKPCKIQRFWRKIMSNYVKLINNFDALKLLTFRANIDSFIDEVNSDKSGLVDALYSLTEKEMAFRQERVNRAMIVTSHFPFVKTFDDYDFTYQPKLNKDEILDLKNLRFIETNDNIVFMGTPGTGKTHLAISIGVECARNRYQTYFINCNELILQLKKAKHENTLARRFKHFTSYSVLIIDEVGFLPIESEDSNLLFQLISMRYEKHPTIFTTNKSFNHWGEVFGDSVIANAMLDRILHHSKVFQIVGPSYRMKGKEDLFKDD